MQGIRLLPEYDLVVGPATDGGFYLAGFSGPWDSILQGINWGTNRVLEQVIENARRSRLKWKLLEEKSDLDTFEDLRMLVQMIRLGTIQLHTPTGKRLALLAISLVNKYTTGS